MKLKEEPSKLAPFRGLLFIFLVYVVGAVSGAFCTGLGYVICLLGAIPFHPLARVILFGCGFAAGIVGMVLAVQEANNG